MSWFPPSRGPKPKETETNLPGSRQRAGKRPGVQTPVRTGPPSTRDHNMAPLPGVFVKKPRKKIAQRQLELRMKLFPEVGPDWLWSRHVHNGFTTLPRCMPIMMGIMDDLAKGQPVSMTYLELWCRSFDENFVVLSKPQNTAFHAGFTGQRAERTWRARLKILEDLCFIILKDGPSGPASYAIILNPYKVIAHHHEAKTPGLRQDKYHALIERAIEVGDESFLPPETSTTASAAAEVAPTVVATKPA